MRSVGSVAFRKLPGSSADLAQKFKVSVATVDAWKSGRRKPQPAHRRAIARAGGPPAKAWDQEPEKPAPKQRSTPPAKALPTKATPEAARALADQLLADARTLQAEIMAVEDGDLARKARLLRDLARVTTELGKLTGAAQPNERAIRASPHWRALVDFLVETLEPWPDAMRALGQALLAREGES